MAISKIGLDLDSLNNVSAPNITISTDQSQIVNDIFTTASRETNGLVALPILSTIAFIVYYTLADKTQFGDFGYSDLKALALSLCIGSVIGIFLIQVQFITSLQIVGGFVFTYLIVFIMILYNDNKE